MLQNRPVFSSFSTNDVEATKAFYGDTLGLDVTEAMGGIALKFPNGHRVYIYPKGDDHQAATFTVLNFAVEDIGAAVDWLAGRGITFERYEGMEHDEKGIVSSPEMGPDIAWFTDPAGNILAVLEGDPEAA